MQNDAEDFASKLIDHLDTALSPPPSSSSSSSSSSERTGDKGKKAKKGNEGKRGSRGRKGRNTNKGEPRHLMNGTVFGGRNIHITDRRLGGCPHVSERTEPFVCLDIEVQVHTL